MTDKQENAVVKNATILENNKVSELLQFVLWIAHESGVKFVDFIMINKLLYRIDTESYLNHGQPLLGLTYVTTVHGPFIKGPEYLHARLLSIGFIINRPKRYSDAFTIHSFSFIDTEVPKTSSFSDAEKDLIETIVHNEMFEYDVKEEDK